MAATRADVARLAGVSPSTVSYVLSGKRPTSPETQERVRQVVKELGYSPNNLASGLASPAIRTIGVFFRLHRLIVDTTDLSYVAGVREAAHEGGARVVLPVIRGESPLQDLQNLVRSRSIDAAVLMDVVQDDEREPLLLNEQIPTVMIGSSGREAGAPSIDADFSQETRLCLEHLQVLGHRRVLAAMREVHAGGPHVYHQQVHTLRENAEQLGMELDVHCTAESVLDGARMVSQDGLVGSCTAFIPNNTKAMNGIVCAADAYGMQMPRDYSGVALGLSEEAATPQRLLTESSVNRRDMGYRAGKLLLGAEGTKQPTKVFMQAELFDRGSTGTAKR